MQAVCRSLLTPPPSLQTLSKEEENTAVCVAGGLPVFVIRTKLG